MLDTVGSILMPAYLSPEMEETLYSGAMDVPWEKELEKRANRIHIIACKVAIVAVPAFFITDIFIAPDHWLEFLIYRLIIAAVAAGLLLLRRWINIWDTMLVFIPFTLISLLNAYMWSTMDVSGLQMHSFSYMALFLAGGMLLLWRSHYIIKVVILSLAFNVLTFYLFSSLSFSDIMSNGGALTLAVAIFSVVLMENRYRTSKDEIISRLLLKKSNILIEKKNKEILDSITYAKRIQEAILPSDLLFDQYLPNAWVYYRPKDIVAGDFYWLEKKGPYIFVAVADCTGHGVPGAMVSVVCSNALNRAVNELDLVEPSQILDSTREIVIETFAKSNKEVADGMDIAFCRIDTEARTLVFSGAHSSLYHITPHMGDIAEKEIADDVKKLVEYKGDKQPIGSFIEARPFSQKIIQLTKGDQFFMTSDGFPDQFGGNLGKKFYYKPMKKLFLKISKDTLQQQKSKVEEVLLEWMGEKEQVDDICMMGILIQ